MDEHEIYWLLVTDPLVGIPNPNKNWDKIIGLNSNNISAKNSTQHDSHVPDDEQNP
jgi:hypothetical protein